MNRFREWYGSNRGLFIGLCIGVAVAVLFLTIGFWATLLIAVCAGVGAYFGKHSEVRERIGQKISEIFKRDDE